MGCCLSNYEARNIDHVTSFLSIVIKIFFLLLVCASCSSAKVITDGVKVDIHKASEDNVVEIEKLKSFTHLAKSGLQEMNAKEHHDSHMAHLNHSPFDEWKAISHGIGHITDFMKAGFLQNMAKKRIGNHATRFTQDIVEEWRAISHGFIQLADLIKAGIKRMLAYGQGREHRRLSEVLRSVGHYLQGVVNGMETGAELRHVAASFYNDAPAVRKAVSVILQKLRPMLDYRGIIQSRFENSPRADGKGISPAIQRFTDLAKTELQQRQPAEVHGGNHVNWSAHSPVDEWKLIYHAVGRLAELINANIKRMMHNNRNQEQHLKLYEVLRPIGHYLRDWVDANGDGMVTRAKVIYSAESFDHEESEMGKVVSAIFKGLWPTLGTYIQHEILTGDKGLDYNILTMSKLFPIGADTLTLEIMKFNIVL